MIEDQSGKQIHSRDHLEAQNNDVYVQDSVLLQNDFAIDKIQKRINEQIHLQYKSKDPVITNLIMRTLRNHFIFYNLSEQELENIKEKMLFCQVGQGNYIYRQGDIGTCFFIIQKGSVQLLSNQKFQKDIRVPQGFGEIALLYNTQRISSIRTKEDCKLWVIDRLMFREAIEEMIVKEYRQNRKVLENCQIFSGIQGQYKDKVASVSIQKVYYKDQALIKEGDPGSCFFLIKSGSASAYKGSKFIRKLNKGDCFGEQSLFYNTMRQLTIRSDQTTVVLIVSRDSLNKIMGEKIYEVTFKNFIKNAFQNNRILDKLKKTEAQALIEHMRVSNFKPNQMVFRRGVTGFQKIVVIIQGQLKQQNGEGVVAIKGQCFGQQGILQQNQNKILDDEIVMNSYGVVAELTNYEIIKKLGINTINQSKPNDREINESYVQNRLKKQVSQVNANKLQVVKVFSKSLFGEDILVRDSKSGSYYCLKGYYKKIIEDHDVSKYILNQGQVLKKVSHPFILATGKILQTKTKIYYLTQYVDGENLEVVMDKIGLFSTKDAQFYAASIILILEYFAANCIIIRDLKPENFKVDSLGYLRLMNLSICKQTSAQGKLLTKTFTIVGTPHYMAPDVILGKGYSNMVDLWALGVIVFEMLCGYLPFGDQTQNTYEIYESIMQQQLKFPSYIIDKKAIRFITQLLSHNPETRLNNSFQGLKSHLWLEGIAYKQLLRTHYQKQVPYRARLSEQYGSKVIPRTTPIKQYLKNNESESGQVEGSPQIWKGFGQHII